MTESTAKRMTVRELREHVEESIKAKALRKEANHQATRLCIELRIHPHGVDIAAWLNQPASFNLPAMTLWVEERLKDPAFLKEAEFTSPQDVLCTELTRLLQKIEDSTPW